MNNSNFQPYPAYKPSGMPWLDDVPEHWGITPVKRHYTIQLGKMLQNSRNGPTDVEVPYLKARHVQWFSVRITDLPRMWANAHDIEQFGIRIGDLLVCEGGEGGRSGLVREAQPGHIIQNALHRVRPYGSSRNDYLEYLMSTIAQSGWFDAINSKATIAHFTTEKFGSLLIPHPPLHEQRAIVRYLDYVDRRIRRYVSAKRKLIALLEEEKQAIVNRAVTRGLDPNVRLKPSGVEWLGDLPRHWNILPLKRWVSTKITDGPHETPALLADGIPFMSAESMVGGRLDFSRRRGFISREQHEVYCRKCRPQRDDIFMCKSGATTGKVAIIETADEFSVWSPLALIRVDPHRVLARLLFAALQAPYVQRQVKDTWSYGTQPNLSMRAMERLVVVLPPLDEQQEVLAHLERATKALSEAVDRTRRQIDLLQEYRTRLIADVVTGKLDVREAAAQLPDEPGDEEPIDEGRALADDADGDLYDAGNFKEQLAMESEVRA